MYGSLIHFSNSKYTISSIWIGFTVHRIFIIVLGIPNKGKKARKKDVKPLKKKKLMGGKESSMFHMLITGCAWPPYYVQVCVNLKVLKNWNKAAMSSYLWALALKA